MNNPTQVLEVRWRPHNEPLAIPNTVASNTVSSTDKSLPVKLHTDYYMHGVTTQTMRLLLTDTIL